MKIKGKPRHIMIEEGTYFITSHTVNFHPIFRDTKLITIFIDCLKKVQNTLKFHLYAYAVLLNHFHLLLGVTKGGNLREIMFRIKGSSAREINKARGIKGRGVWQDRYHDHSIRDERDRENHCDYIHFNPVKHQLVTQPELWPWSSYRVFLKKGYYELGWGETEPKTTKGIDYELTIPG